MTVAPLARPHLQLVASSPGSARRNLRYRTEAALGRRGRALHREILSSALAVGDPVDPDALRLIVAIRERQGVDLHHLTTDDVWRLLFTDVVAWCRARRLDLPGDCARALRALIDHLDATDAFTPTSDSPERLHEAVSECTGDWDRRRASR